MRKQPFSMVTHHPRMSECPPICIALPTCVFFVIPLGPAAFGANSGAKKSGTASGLPSMFARGDR
jgi:hypothetical protein